MKSEVVVYDKIPFSEGPVWCDDGTLVVTSVAAGALFRVWPNEQRAELCAQTDGGANGAALAADGSILVAQNGGMDFSNLPGGLFGDLPESPKMTPGLQLARPDGTVTYLADHGPATARTTSRSRRTATCTSPTRATTRRPRTSSSAA